MVSVLFRAAYLSSELRPAIIALPNTFPDGFHGAAPSVSESLISVAPNY